MKRPERNYFTTRVKTNALPFSSTVYTDVLPTDTCFSFCLDGEGMWYQQSPAEGDNTTQRNIFSPAADSRVFGLCEIRASDQSDLQGSVQRRSLC